VDLVLKGRGVRITDQIRRTAEHKTAKILHLEPRIARMEVEVFLEHNPRINDNHRVEVACDTTRHVFRAAGSGQDVDTALDQVIQRLERQITKHHRKLRDRRQAGPMV
jgi:putative sigma-54 modulation protein